MGLILNRIDARLIHGQITTGWLGQTGAENIIVLDNPIATDPYMQQIFKMAAPPGHKLWTMTTTQIAEAWQKDKLDSYGKIMCLSRNVPTVYEAYKKGFTYTDLLVGGIGGAPGRINVHGPITLSEPDAKMLKELEDLSVHIWFQSNIEEPQGEWKPIRTKYFPNI
jgi:D-glucosaminate PTS system EIIB component